MSFAGCKDPGYPPPRSRNLNEKPKVDARSNAARASATASAKVSESVHPLPTWKL